LQNNLSRDSIEKNINGSIKDPKNLMTLEFECYGPNGIQIIITALTDNINRITSNIKGYLSKLHAEIAKPNSVKIFFNNYGYIVVVKNKANVDQLLEITMEYDIVDIIEQEDAFEILTSPKDFFNVKNILNKNNIKIFDSEIKLIAQNKINFSELTEEIQNKINKFISSCEEDDEIQTTITNIEFDND
jgi:YebC/PmpR family DNA-binding regulatory protein